MKDTVILACTEPATIGMIIGSIASKGGVETKDDIRSEVKRLVDSGELLKSGARRGTRYQAKPGALVVEIDSEDLSDDNAPLQQVKELEAPETVVEVYNRLTGFIAKEERLKTWMDTWKFVCICAQELSLHPFDVVENLPRLVLEEQVDARWTPFSNQYRVRRPSV